MEREPNPPRQFPPPASSSPPRASDFLRQVQAAFKRSRPPGGTMVSNIGRARRVPVLDGDSSKISSLGGDNASVAGKLRGHFAKGTGSQDAEEPLREDSSCALLSTSSSMPSSHNDEIISAGAGRFTSTTDALFHAQSFQHGAVDEAQKLQFAVEDIVCSGRPAALSKRACVAMPTRTATMDSISSHMHSIALTESECAEDVQLGFANWKNNSNHKQSDFHRAEVSDINSTKSSVTHLASMKDDFMFHQIGQSGAGLSSVVTTLTSVSEPMLNLTTCNSSSNMDVDILEEFNLDPRPAPRGSFVKALGPKFQSTSVGSTTQTAVSTLVSTCAPEASFGSQDNSLSKGPGLLSKGLDNPKAIHLEDKFSRSKLAGGDCQTLQPQGQSTKIPASNLNKVPPQSNQTANGATGRGPTRKKNYDPDVFFKVNGKLYQKLGKIGSGGSSEVYKVISSDCTIYALKKIKLRGRDYSTAYGFYQEIEYLKKLKGKGNIIQLVDYEVTDKRLLEEVECGSVTTKDIRIRDDGYIYMVLEYGEIDLAHMLSQKWKDIDSSAWNIDENWLRFYWQQMLLAVNTIHEERIVHSDLKPANFLLVRGSLKLIDFGIAKAIMSDTTNIQRDAQVGTLNYMSPEAFMWNDQDASANTIKCGRPSDIWSLGCILYQMVYGRTPFAEYKTFWAKFKVITDRNHEIKYGPVSNPWLVDLMKKCLAWDRDTRWRIPQLLQHPFLVPQIPHQAVPLREQHSNLLKEINETYKNIPQVSYLCSQLQHILTHLSES